MEEFCLRPVSARRFVGPWRRYVAVAVISTLIVGLAPQRASAQWHSQADSLPGLVSGQSILILALVGGAAVAGLLIYRHRKGAKKVELEIQPPRFADVTVGGSEQKSVGITNLMGDPVTIKELSLLSDKTTFSLASGRQVPFTVAPGERVEILIHFSPVSGGGSSGRLRIVASSPAVKKDTVTVVGFSASGRQSGRSGFNWARTLAAAGLMTMPSGKKDAR